MSERYYVFACKDYYPAGGAKDFIDSFDSLDVAINVANCLCEVNRCRSDFSHVTNSNMEIVYENYSR
jgi:hypothetical protein